MINISANYPQMVASPRESRGPANGRFPLLRFTVVICWTMPCVVLRDSRRSSKCELNQPFVMRRDLDSGLLPRQP